MPKNAVNRADPIGQPMDEHETFRWSTNARVPDAVNTKFKELRACTLFFISSSF